MFKHAGDKVIVIVFFAQKISGRIKGGADFTAEQALGFGQAFKEFAVAKTVGNHHDVDVAVRVIRAFGDRAKNKRISNF